MTPRLTVPAACLLLLCGCAEPRRLQEGPGAEHLGAPSPAVDAAVPSGIPDGAERPAIRLPDRITLPASYRLMLLDGHLALVREADPQALEGAPTSMRVVAGEIARGELAYQPGLLPQELAAEVAANRESAARMDNALDTVMDRSRELSEQALELQAQSRKLAELLSASQARVRELEAASAAQAKGRPPLPNPDSPQD
jgi:uncharacterized coiled-coil protein SlyX